MKHRAFRMLALALALALVCGVALAEVRTTANVWMRKGPGIDYGQVICIAGDTSLTYLDETRVDERGVAWYRVSDGQHTGWVSSKFAQLVEDAPHTPEPSPTSAPAPTPTPSALETGQLFATLVAGGREDPATGRWKELSACYLEDLVTAANELGLISYREVKSEAPYQYYNDALILAGSRQVENIVIYGEGYELFGVRVGMTRQEAMAFMTASGLDRVGDADEPDGEDDAADADGEGRVACVTYEHRGTEQSLFTDEAGHDSCVNLTLDENGVVMMIDWSSYTG